MKIFFDGKRCILAHWLRYAAYPGHIECFLGGGPKVGRRVLMVHLLAKMSRVYYFGGSHLLELPAKPGEKDTLEIPESAIPESCQPRRKDFVDGGK